MSKERCQIGKKREKNWGEGETERNVLVTAMEHISVCNSKHTKNIK
jgi:hypothetical protein